MALIKGICKNFGECELADNKEVQEVDKTNFVCEECGKPLHPVNGVGVTKTVGGGPNWKLIGIIAAAVVVLAGIGAAIYFMKGRSEIEIAKIELKPKSLTLVVDNNSHELLKASILDKEGKEIKDANVTYNWTSDDESIVSVTANGEVKAVKEGKTTIKVNIEGNDKVPAGTCRVKVVSTSDIPGGKTTSIQQLTIKGAKDFALKKGNTQQLAFVAVPDPNTETPVWESSNPSVASVNANGLVTAIAKGSATITIKAASAYASVNVTVEEQTTEPPRVGLSYGRYTGDRNKQGQPHGFGDVVFTKSKLVTGNTYAEPGYKIRNARFVNGKLQSGTLYDTDGNKVCFIDANNNL